MSTWLLSFLIIPENDLTVGELIEYVIYMLCSNSVYMFILDDCFCAFNLGLSQGKIK